MRRGIHSRPDIVAVGASAGGIEAMVRLLSALPEDFPGTVLFVVHRSPERANHLQGVLAARSRLPVEVAREGAHLQGGICYIAPAGRHLTVTPGLTFHLLPDGFYRGNSIDVLFGSLARCAGAHTIGVVLSGLLKDGTLGLKSIKEAGGVALVQEPGEAAFPDMPLNAIEGDGQVDFVGPVGLLAAEIRRRVGTAIEISPRA